MSGDHARCWGVIPAAGTGSRMGGEVPKQYQLLAGATILEHSLGALLDCDLLAAVMVALHPQDHSSEHMACFEDARVLNCTGGAERSDSVLAALEALGGRAADEDWVLVHDAARPCVSVSAIVGLIETVRGNSIGGILAEPVLDTVKQAGADGRVVRTLDRATLWRAQTPQMFRLGRLREALLQAAERGLVVTDESSAMEMAGHPVQLVASSSRNLKITVPADLPLADWYLGHPDARGVGG